MKILGIEHVAIAIEGLEEPARIFHQLLGIRDRKTEEVADQQVITDIFDTGAGKVDLIDQEPRVGAGGCQTAFLHPHSTAGVLVELCQRP